MKKRFKTFFIVLSSSLLLVIICFLLHYFSGYEIHRNVKYGEKEINVMDIYLPTEARAKDVRGCVLFIHGGSWSGGDKAEEAARCRLLASQGYLAATVDYTLWSEDTTDTYHVCQVLGELDAALLQIKEFAAERGIAIDQAAVSGYSAGAHLAMLYAYSRGETAPLDIAFAASMAGPADISPEVWGEDMTIRVARRLTGEEITAELLRSGEADALLDSVSPVSFIDENTPPTIIMQGRKDPVVPPANADSLIEKFDAHGIPYDYIPLKNSDHSLLQNPLQHIKYCKTLLTYCKTYFE